LNATRLHRSRWRAIALIALTLSGLLAAGACSNDGKTLRPPPPGATAPLRTTSTTSGVVAPQPPAPGLLSLTSPDFEPAGTLPDALTCAGEGRSPALAWTSLPAGVVEIAVVVTDTDADLFANWVVAGLDPALAAIAGGALPEGAVTALNGDGAPGYAAPCPPAGATHTYEFALYALFEPSGVVPEMPASEAIAALDARAGTRAVITATATG
jgi:phosphatidylethanolamine-binding protein (PEBP) family uncharacterized protein